MYKIATADRSSFFLLDVDGPPEKRYRMKFDKYFAINNDDSDSDEEVITLNELQDSNPK